MCVLLTCVVEECRCMCKWCQESREHYLQGVCACATCNQGVSHRSVMSRCNCTQCREFRSHSGFKLLQHTQSCTACQVCIRVKILFGGLLIPVIVVTYLVYCLHNAGTRCMCMNEPSLHAVISGPKLRLYNSRVILSLMLSRLLQ